MTAQTNLKSTLPTLSDFVRQSQDKIRYVDTDRQGHVNNAAFSSFLETGRVDILLNSDNPLNSKGCQFVIAQLTINYFDEINWPGTIDIGTRVVKVGRSSINLNQGLFQNGICVATADTVIVQMNEQTRRSEALSEHALEQLQKLTSSQS